MDTYFGKYRGTVTGNVDPNGLGRIQAHVPDVHGSPAHSWAMPCAPFAGPGMGFFALPPVGAGVWIEFEYGDPERPIWSGCWWGSAHDVPSIAIPVPPHTKTLIRTEGGNSILLDDTPGGGITLQTASGQKIVMTSAGIEIDTGTGAKIALTGRQVSINDDALEVT